MSECSIKGGVVSDVRRELEGMDLRDIFCVILFVGGCNLYSRGGSFKGSRELALSVGRELSSLEHFLWSQGVRVIVNPILLRVNHLPNYIPRLPQYAWSHLQVFNYNKTVHYCNKVFDHIDNPLNTSSRQAASNFYYDDGQHLNSEGRLALAWTWANIIRSWKLKV